jgi:ABC-type maltose transport system permease subunit
MLLEFLNLGTSEIILLLIVCLPFLFIAFCVIDIARSKFKSSTHKLLFLLLVIFAPFIGSLVYLVMKKDYVVSQQIG